MDPFLLGGTLSPQKQRKVDVWRPGGGDFLIRPRRTIRVSLQKHLIAMRGSHFHA